MTSPSEPDAAPTGQSGAHRERVDAAVRDLLVTVRCAARTVIDAANHLEAVMKETDHA